MAELKTKRNDGDVEAFVAGIENPTKRTDCQSLLQLMREVTGDEPAMWGDAIVGFGSVHYRYASGREGDWFEVGFAPRKQNLTLYLMSGLGSQHDLLERLGKHSTGKGCLYVKRLADVDETVLREMIERSVQQARQSGEDPEPD